jgi:CubicO group peptidase (beta-lactamase class C family)
MNFYQKLKTVVITTLLTLLASCDRGTPVAAGEGFPGTHWEIKSPEAVQLDADKLKTNFQHFPGPIAVIREGYLIYSKGDIRRSISSYSVSKSITALLFATLLQQGKITYDSPIPNSDFPTPPPASSRHFLSMTSDYGLEPHQPGKHYAYNNNAIDFYGQYLSNHFFAGRSPRRILQQALWKYIGRQDPVSFEGQWGGWGGGYRMSTRDLARIGLLVLNQGNWNGQQILPASFVEQLYESQIPAEAEANYDRGPNDQWNQHRSTQELKGNYSFGWWIVPNPDQPNLPNAIYGSGWMGKILVVCPEYSLVIAAMPHQENAPDASAYLEAVLNAAISLPGSSLR